MIDGMFFSCWNKAQRLKGGIDSAFGGPDSVKGNTGPFWVGSGELSLFSKKKYCFIRWNKVWRFWVLLLSFFSWNRWRRMVWFRKIKMWVFLLSFSLPFSLSLSLSLSFPLPSMTLENDYDNDQYFFSSSVVTWKNMGMTRQLWDLGTVLRRRSWTWKMYHRLTRFKFWRIFVYYVVFFFNVRCMCCLGYISHISILLKGRERQVQRLEKWGLSCYSFKNGISFDFHSY